MLTAMMIALPLSWAIPAIFASCSVIPSFRVLLRDPFLRVDDEDRNVCSLDRAHGADDHIALKIFLDLVLSPKTCRIDENVVLAVVPDPCIDRVPRRTGNIGDDHAVLPDQFIYDRRFSDIRLSDDRDIDGVVFHFFTGPVAEMADHLVQKITDAGAVR